MIRKKRQKDLSYILILNHSKSKRMMQPNDIKYDGELHLKIIRLKNVCLKSKRMNQWMQFVPHKSEQV